MCLCLYLQRKQRVPPGKENESEASRARGWLTLGKVKRWNMSKHERKTFFNCLEISFTFSKVQSTTHSMHGLFFYKRASSELETQKVVRHRVCSKPGTTSSCITGVWWAKRGERGIASEARHARDEGRRKNKACFYYFFLLPSSRAKCRVRLPWLIKHLLCRLALNKCLSLNSTSWS